MDAQRLEDLEAVAMPRIVALALTGVILLATSHLPAQDRGEAKGTRYLSTAMEEAVQHDKTPDCFQEWVNRQAVLPTICKQESVAYVLKRNEVIHGKDPLSEHAARMVARLEAAVAWREKKPTFARLKDILGELFMVLRMDYEPLAYLQLFSGEGILEEKGFAYGGVWLAMGDLSGEKYGTQDPPYYTGRVDATPPKLDNLQAGDILVRDYIKEGIVTYSSKLSTPWRESGKETVLTARLIYLKMPRECQCADVHCFENLARKALGAAPSVNKK